MRNGERKAKQAEGKASRQAAEELEEQADTEM
jgi:hypothetical protein